MQLQINRDVVEWVPENEAERAALEAFWLLLIPSGSDGAEDGYASEAESRLESVLAEVEGAGRVRVLCSEEGAAVVCEGAADASVRLAVTRAVAAYTGLGSNEITVLPMRDE